MGAFTRRDEQGNLYHMPLDTASYGFFIVAGVVLVGVVVLLMVVL